MARNCSTTSSTEFNSSTESKPNKTPPETAHPQQLTISQGFTTEHTEFTEKKAGRRFESVWDSTLCLPPLCSPCSLWLVFMRWPMSIYQWPGLKSGAATRSSRRRSVLFADALEVVCAAAGPQGAERAQNDAQQYESPGHETSLVSCTARRRCIACSR